VIGNHDEQEQSAKAALEFDLRRASVLVGAGADPVRPTALSPIPANASLAAVLWRTLETGKRPVLLLVLAS
jgi:hypothetical protein